MWNLPFVTSLFFAAFPGYIDGFSSGAPRSQCNAMVPEHSYPPQTAQAPYKITLSQTEFSPGDSITVTLTGINGQIFTGYLLQGRDENGNSIRGGFTGTGTTGKSLSCETKSNAGVTHFDKSRKSNDSFTWTAPSDADGNMVIVATVVASYSTFWMGVKSAVLRLSSSDITTEPQLVTVTDLTAGTLNTAQPTFPDDLMTLVPTESVTSTTEATTPVPPTSALLMDPDCGKTKGCFVDCKTDSCDYVATWKSTEDWVEFSLSMILGEVNNKWIAIGFSDDMRMGDDEVIHCISNSEGVVNVARSYNPGKRHAEIANPSEGLSETGGYVKDGVFNCKFRRSLKHRRTKRQAEEGKFVDLEEDHYLMFGYGPASGTALGMHGKDPVVTAGRVDFQSVAVIGDVARFPLVKVHACLMIVAWIFCTGVGLVVARFYKPVWSDRTILGLKVWFQMHRALMVTTLVLTVVGFIIIFVEAGGYSRVPKIEGKEFTQAHPILGIIVTILCLINPIMALFRPGPKDKNRPLFNWAHWGVGMASHILSVITICFGVEMEKITSPRYTLYVVIGYVIYHVLMEILLKAFDLCADKPDTVKVESMEMKNGNSSTNGNSYRVEPGEDKKDGKDSVIKKILLIFHMAIAFAFTLTLVLLIARY